jgi:hypothetical protein
MSLQEKIIDCFLENAPAFFLVCVLVTAFFIAYKIDTIPHHDHKLSSNPCEFQMRQTLNRALPVDSTEKVYSPQAAK